MSEFLARVATLISITATSVGVPVPAVAAQDARSSELRLTPSSAGLPANVSAEGLHSELEQAARTWSYPEVPCTASTMRIESSASLRTSWQDGVNAVLFRTDAWCHNARCGGLRTFPSLATAMTTPYPARAAGQLDRPNEADIELNGVDYVWHAAGLGATAIEPAESRPRLWLRAVLVHELGHALGFGDRCLLSRSRQGVGADPRCTTAEQASVMFVGSRSATLSPLDIEQLCRRYPRSGSGGSVPGITASSGGSRVGLWSVPVLLSFFALVWGGTTRRFRWRFGK